MRQRQRLALLQQAQQIAGLAPRLGRERRRADLAVQPHQRLVGVGRRSGRRALLPPDDPACTSGRTARRMSIMTFPVRSRSRPSAHVGRSGPAFEAGPRGQPSRSRRDRASPCAGRRRPRARCPGRVQVHRSHWVAHAHVRRIAGTAGDAARILSNELRMPIGRRRWKAVRKRFGRGVVHTETSVSFEAPDATFPIGHARRPAPRIRDGPPRVDRPARPTGTGRHRRFGVNDRDGPAPPGTGRTSAPLHSNPRRRHRAVDLRFGPPPPCR